MYTGRETIAVEEGGKQRMEIIQGFAGDLSKERMVSM
jgi:hypothetical protein